MYMLIDDYSDCPWIVENDETERKIYGMPIPDDIIEDALQRSNRGGGVDQYGCVDKYDCYYFDSKVIDKYNTYIVHKLFNDYSFQKDFIADGWQAYLLDPDEFPNQGAIGRYLFRDFLIDLAEKEEIYWFTFHLHDIPGIKIWKQEDENE